MAESKHAFVRTAILPAQAPPLTEKGAIKWLRENLFSGWFNTILTLVGLWAIYSLIAASLPWWLNGVWTAGSLGECREIIAKTAGPDATGACWAMVRERWHQFLFGFYPQDQYWRPILAFVLNALIVLAGLAALSGAEIRELPDVDSASSTSPAWPKACTCFEKISR